MQKMTTQEVQDYLKGIDCQHLTSNDIDRIKYRIVELFTPLLPCKTMAGITITHNTISLTTSYGLFFFDNGYYGRQPDGRDFYLTIRFDLQLMHGVHGMCKIERFDRYDLENMGKMVREVHDKAIRYLSGDS